MIRILFGPTASGKSAAALAAARTLGGTIINADALQLYEALPILTAQPSAAEQADAPHRLYGFRDPRTPMNAGEWATLAAQEIEGGDKPILVGGTGLYITTLLDGIAPIPDTPPHIRAELEALQAERGNEALMTELEDVDPRTADTIDPNNKQRLIRAVEVYRATGEPLSAWHAKPKITFLPEGTPVQLVVLTPDKEWVHDRATKRFDAMLDMGVLDEVAAFAQNHGTTGPATQALGFHTLWAHVEGQMTRDEARRKIVQDTKDYIKRQMTWARQQMATREGALVVGTPDAAASALAQR